MSEPKNRTDTTSADKQQLGFEYQYLYFILQLLKMQPGGSVGYEALDDVHTISAESKQITYIQVKHTIDTAADGSQATLPRLSLDLWKTLSNWSKVISDPAEVRQTAKAQMDFIKNTRFVLVVNRIVETNEVVKQINKVKANELTASAIKAYLEDLRKKTSNKELQALIDDVKALSNRVLVSFLSHVEITSTISNLLDDICDNIRAKMVPNEYVNDVLNQLYAQLKIDFFQKVQQCQHQVISFDEWTKKYRGVFSTYQTTLLPFRKFQLTLPEHLEEQVFVKELLEIGAFDLSRDGLAEIAELTRFYLNVQLQLDAWYDDGKITHEDRDRFHRNAKLTWKRIHQSSHRSTASDINQDYSNALSCYYAVIREELRILSTELGLELSNGEFIKLANEKKIGWKYNWEGGNS